MGEENFTYRHKNWSELSMREKADMMKVAIRNGITNLSDIKAKYNEFAEGGSIHIKPSHKGRLTELKERTGKTEAELYNDGNPAHKKMVVFARNARGWKHGDGGHLYAGGGGIKKYVGDLKDITYDANNMKFYEKATGKELGDSAILDELVVTGRNRTKDFLTESNDATQVRDSYAFKDYNPHLRQRAEQGAISNALWEQEHPNVTSWRNIAESVPFVVAAAPAVMAGGEALASTALGQGVTSGLNFLAGAAKASPIVSTVWPYADAGLTSVFGAHGASEIAKGNVTPETLLEVAPLLQLTKPIGKAVTTLGKSFNKPFTITPKNYTKVTDTQWDKAYSKALDAGDMEEAERLEALHFKLKAPNNKAVTSTGLPTKSYHTVSDRYDPNFTVFDTNIEGHPTAIYTTDNPIMSGSYTNKVVSEGEKDYYTELMRQNELENIERGHSTGSSAEIRKMILEDPERGREWIINNTFLKGPVESERQKAVFTNLENPVIFDNQGRNWNNITLNELPKDVYSIIKEDVGDGFGAWTTRSVERAQRELGYDGAIINNVVDYGGSSKSRALFGGENKPSTVFEVNSPNNVKLVGPTFDDAGNLIPLSQRHDFSNPDIRYLKGADLQGTEYELPVRTMRGGVEGIDGNILSDEELISNWKRSQDFYKMRLRSRGLSQEAPVNILNDDKAYQDFSSYFPKVSKDDWVNYTGGGYAISDGKDSYGIVTKKLDSLGKQRRGTANNATTHESAHLMRDKEPMELEDINWSNMKNIDKEEAAARGTQIKSMLGLKDLGTITPKQLRYMKDNYVRLTGQDNKMQAFLDSITDFDSAAAWLSKNAFSYGGAILLNYDFLRKYPNIRFL